MNAWKGRFSGCNTSGKQNRKQALLESHTIDRRNGTPDLYSFGYINRRGESNSFCRQHTKNLCENKRQKENGHRFWGQKKDRKKEEEGERKRKRQESLLQSFPFSSLVGYWIDNCFSLAGERERDVLLQESEKQKITYCIIIVKRAVVCTYVCTCVCMCVRRAKGRSLVFLLYVSLCNDIQKPEAAAEEEEEGNLRERKKRRRDKRTDWREVERWDKKSQGKSVKSREREETSNSRLTGTSFVHIL